MIYHVPICSSVNRLRLFLYEQRNVYQVSEIFGGLEVCALELVVGKDGREHIIELNDSATTFMGDSQEEDRRHLAELVLQRMQVTRELFYIIEVITLSFELSS